MKRIMMTVILYLFLASYAFAQLTAQPIEDLLTAPLELSPLTPTSATLEVTTTQDLACVVVYGTDETFGQLALDSAMGASAHQDHLVQLRGLEPDTVYVYRLQGSSPDGTFYASETISFRTPPADEGVNLGTDVATQALGASITEVSSNFGGGSNDSRFGADSAIDNDPDTEWSSAGDGNGAFITVALPEAVQVSGFGLWTRTMGTSAQIGSFEVVNEAGETFGPFEVPDASGIYTFPAEGSGQKFTFRVMDSSGGNTGVVEVAVYTTGD